MNDRSDHLSRLKLITAIDLYLNLARELQLASSSLGSAFPCLVTLLVYICKPLGFPQYLRKETDAFELLLPKSFSAVFHRCLQYRWSLDFETNIDFSTRSQVSETYLQEQLWNFVNSGFLTRNIRSNSDTFDFFKI